MSIGMSGQVLLVGLEPLLLSSSAASTRGSGSSWSLTRVGNGTQALEFVDHNEVEAVVVEPRLPDMSGLRLLDQIMQRRPAVHRFILVDFNDHEAVGPGVSAAHFLLTKPFRLDELELALERAARVTVWFGREPILQIMRRLRKVPSPPLLYYQIVAEWQSPSASLERLAELIARDEASSARFLHMANGSLFGPPRLVGRTDEAVTFLGAESTASLLLLAHVCAQFDRVSPYLFSVDELCRHSLATARLARAIARAERQDEETTDQTFMAGLLHDIGKLVLAANAPEMFTRIQREVQIGLSTCCEAEQENFGLTHAEVGAWLAGIWGLPSPVVQAIGFHHQPHRSEETEFCPLDGVHAADVIEHEIQEDLPSASLPRLDVPSLLKKGLAGREQSWSDLARSLFISAPADDTLERPLAA
jgi:putative nucleotidyltransferase with HDIG domain